MSVIQVAAYARVSSEQQVEAGTIHSQLSTIKERIQEDGFTLLPDLTFIDEGYSGAHLIRPALERLRDSVAMRGIDRLYVHSPDRLARKYAYQVLLMDEFQRAGVEVVFINHSLSQSPEDELLLQVQGMMAEYERAKILERSRRGKLHSARSGRVAVLAGAPYGYRYVTKHDGGGEARYEILDEEARVVRQIFDWIGRERLSIGELRRRLQKSGEPTRTRKPYWDRGSIWGILKNPAYKGSAAFGKTKITPPRPRLRPQRGAPDQPRHPKTVVDVAQEQWISIPVPALVSEELFEAVQEQLEENRKRAREGQRGVRYLLQGLLTCAQCRYSYYGKPISYSSAKGKHRDYAYYRCIGSDAYRFGGERICDNHQVRTDKLDETVWQEVYGLLEEPGRLQEEYQRRLMSPDKEGGEIETTRAQMGKIKQAMGRLIDSYAEGLITRDEFEPRIGRLRQRLGDLEKRVQDLSHEIETQRQLRLIITCLEDFAVKVRDGLADADWMTKRELIRMLVKRVEIGKEEINVIFRIAPSPFESSPQQGGLQHCWGRSGTTLEGTLNRLMQCIVFKHASFKKPADKRKKTLVTHTLGHLTHELIVVHSIKEFLEIHIHHEPIASPKMHLCTLKCLMGASSGTKTETPLRKRLVPLGLQYLKNRLLDQAIHGSGHT